MLQYFSILEHSSICDLKVPFILSCSSQNLIYDQYRDCSQTLVGEPVAKKIIVNIFQGPPSDLKKIQGPLFTMKIMGQPHRKSCKLNFYWKICGNFFQGPPLQGSKSLRAPLFASGFPLTSVCEWSLRLLMLNTFRWVYLSSW